jgi:hypothetical protein
MLMSNLLNPCRTVLHFGAIAPHTDERFIFPVEGVRGGRRGKRIAMLEQSNEVAEELLCFWGEGGNIFA